MWLVYWKYGQISKIIHFEWLLSYIHRAEVKPCLPLVWLNTTRRRSSKLYRVKTKDLYCSNKHKKVLTCMCPQSLYQDLCRHRICPGKTTKVCLWGRSTKVIYITKNSVKQQCASILFPSFLTLKSWTPMQANMKSSSMVTSTIFPMVLTATNTHWTTCYKDRDITNRWWIMSAWGRF